MTRQRVVFGLLLAGAISGGCTGLQRPPGPYPPTRIKVVSFNIRNGNAMDGSNAWKKRRSMVFDLLREEDPDFVGVQEALNSQIKHLRKALPEYHHRGRPRFMLPMPVLNEATPIFYRHERWALDKKDEGTRVLSAQLLAERIAERKTQDPVIVTGDFNDSESSTTILYLKGDRGGSPAPLVDTFRVVRPNRRNAGTFGKWKGRTSGPKIDYVFVEDETEVLAADILLYNRDHRYPSDHFPVTAELIVPGRDE